MIPVLYALFDVFRGHFEVIPEGNATAFAPMGVSVRCGDHSGGCAAVRTRLVGCGRVEGHGWGWRKEEQVSFWVFNLMALISNS